MPSVLAHLIAKTRKTTRPSSQPTLSHRALSAAPASDSEIEPRRSRRTCRPSAHKLESDEYQASSRGSSRPPTPSGRKPAPDSEEEPNGKRGNRPGRIVQPNAGTRSTSYSVSPEPIATPGPRPSSSVLASKLPTSAKPKLDKAEAIRRATAFLGTDASKLPARIVQEVVAQIPDDAEETQASPMELEGGSAPTVLQSAGRVVLGSRHQPPATRTTDNIDSQAPNAQSAEAQLPLDQSHLERPFNEDTATESESEPEDIELGPGDSVSQRLPPAVPLLPPTTSPPRPHPTPNSHTLHHADHIERMDFDTPALDESAPGSDSDRDLPAPARKRQRLAEPPRPIHLPHGPRASHPRIPSTTQRPPTHSTSARLAAPTETTSSSSLASLQPPPTSDLSAVLIWAVQQLTRPGVTTGQGASSSRGAGQPETSYDPVAKVLDKIRSNPSTTSGPRVRTRQPLELRHTDPVEDDSEILEAEAALTLGKRVRPRRKPTLSDFPGLPRRIASISIPEFTAVACTRGAYEVFGTLSEWSGETYDIVWRRELGDLQLQKAPQALKSIIVHRLSWFRGETKGKIRPVVPFVYPFIHPPRTRQDLRDNRELAKKLLPSAFHCLDINDPNDRQYEHPALRDCIATAFFSGPAAIGIVYRAKFKPVPLPAVAMVLTIMQHCIKEWKSGRFESRELDVDKQLKVYDAYLKGLLEYAKSAPKRLLDFQGEWFKYGVDFAGTASEDDELCQPITRADRVRPDTPVRGADAGRKGKSRAVD